MPPDIYPCPNCSGRGRVPLGTYNSASSTTDDEVCRQCHGTGNVSSFYSDNVTAQHMTFDAWWTANRHRLLNCEVSTVERAAYPVEIEGEWKTREIPIQGWERLKI